MNRVIPVSKTIVSSLSSLYATKLRIFSYSDKLADSLSHSRGLLTRSNVTRVPVGAASIGAVSFGAAPLRDGENRDGCFLRAKLARG